MKRRGFLTTLAAITAATAMDVFGVPALKAAPKQQRLIAVVNPAWQKAAYEDVFIFNPKATHILRQERTPIKGSRAAASPHCHPTLMDPRPSRFNRREDGTFERVPYFIEVPEEA